ncbi:DUF427 domain-containing protein [Allosaccharopolyspora coralli]|uniref:DUF427 domain-containing protein n=1 Tax=Allosaccharopolyspora coralli TaxID=2665642 RepID=A0A5Q3QAM6_9PSEU|nr:DUF427 domain-containing protein [Allosaccharopolyspora coralli]QGK71711.1 DUF427 domain-containing protein [Allosaccharopolyspora coralli]
MSLTSPGRPLATRGPDTVNYRIDGPPHLLLWEDHPRRIRAVLDGETVLDSTDAKVLHESNLPPQLYVPRQDVRTELLEPTETRTHCPFKGDATYESVRAGERLAEDAVWRYPTPVADAEWLDGYVAVYWSAMDAWFDEDEKVRALRDPYHRVDAVRTSRRVRVEAGPVEVADTRQAVVVSETGLPNRYYVPRSDVRTELLTPSETRTFCPYKGEAVYYSVTTDGVELTDAAWEYPYPDPSVGALADHLCFLADDLHTHID